MPIYDNDLYPRSGDAVTTHGRMKITGTPTDATDLMTKSVTETAINAAVALAVSQIRAVSITKRQTAFFGPVDANGQANYLTAVGNDVKISATTINVGLTWSAGIDTSGPVDRLYVYTADTTPVNWQSFTTDGTFYLYVDYNSGTPLYGTSTLKPVHQTKTPSTPSTGQFWLNTNTYIGYVYNGSTWVATERLFVGEVFVTGSALSTVTTYAYNGRYDSGWFAVAASTSYTLTHNIGVSEYVDDAQFSIDSGGASATKAQEFYVDTDNVAGGMRFSNANTSTHKTYIFSYLTRLQNYGGSDRTSGYSRVSLTRSW